jgi:hypothetical protein
LEKAYDVLPIEKMERWRNNPNFNHLPTVYYNEEKDEYEFLKSSKHPTLKEELKWYNSDDPNAVEFRNNYKLDKSGRRYKYVRKKGKTKTPDYTP